MFQYEDTRPANCRDRLRAEGKPYPKSSCTVCSASIRTGLNTCPYKTNEVELPHDIAQAIKNLIQPPKEDAWYTYVIVFSAKRNGESSTIDGVRVLRKEVPSEKD